MPQRIVLDLPEWADERHLYVFAGIELLAYKHRGEVWMVKTSRCSMCGSCCASLRMGPCEHLVQDGKKRVCGLGSRRPFSCGVSAVPKNRKECTEEFKAVEP